MKIYVVYGTDGSGWDSWLVSIHLTKDGAEKFVADSIQNNLPNITTYEIEEWETKD